MRPSSTAESMLSRAQVQLVLEFHAVRIFAGRSFIRPPGSHAHAEYDPSPDSPESAQRTGSRRARLREILVTDCVEAAIACIDTCRTIRATIALARASYTEFSALRAALLVVTAQCLQSRTDRFRVALKDGIELLKEMSTSGMSARSEFSLIEAFERAISRNDGASESVDCAAGGSEYDQFKKWEQTWSIQGMPGSRLNDRIVPMPPQHSSTCKDKYAQSAPLLETESNFASLPQTLDEFSSLFDCGWDITSENAYI